MDYDKDVKVLGMRWDVKNDLLTFAKQEPNNTTKITK